jgi:hypothetical protein
LCKERMGIGVASWAPPPAHTAMHTDHVHGGSLSRSTMGSIDGPMAAGLSVTGPPPGLRTLRARGRGLTLSRRISEAVGYCRSGSMSEFAARRGCARRRRVAGLPRRCGRCKQSSGCEKSRTRLREAEINQLTVGLGHITSPFANIIVFYRSQSRRVIFDDISKLSRCSTE